MNYLLLLSGIILFALTALDITKTTFSSKGGGMIANVLSKAVWNVFFQASGRNGTSRLLSYAGPVVLISILLFWVSGLWFGFFLMLLSDPDSILNSTT